MWIGGGLLILLFAAMIVAAKYFVEPVLRQRLKTIIVEGSDSLYHYSLGALEVSLLGGKVEISDLDIKVDSNRYKLLQEQKLLPAVVLELQLEKAGVRGIDVLALLFSRKVFIGEIESTQANVRLFRHPNSRAATDTARSNLPLWKAIRPSIKAIEIGSVKLNGIKLLYKNAEGEEATKLQFDRCDAVFTGIRIDSTALIDTGRMGYLGAFALQLNDIKYRTTDSTYKMKAEWVKYNSQTKLLEIDSFKLQPTIKNEDRVDSFRTSWYTVLFDKVHFMGLRLDSYLRFNRAEADSVVFTNPRLSVYQDKLGAKTYQSKIGSYPHQKLLNANSHIRIKKFIAKNMEVQVQEKHEITRRVGAISLTHLDVVVENIVNRRADIEKDPVCRALARGKILGSPLEARFAFYLDSAEGRFDLSGSVGRISAAALNPVASTLSSVVVPSVIIHQINFLVRGEDFGAEADVQMKYNNLSLILNHTDEKTGGSSVRKFLTKWLNRFVLYTDNPSEGRERIARGVKTARLTTQSFFGIIWKALFAGMQQVMIRSGQVS